MRWDDRIGGVDQMRSLYARSYSNNEQDNEEDETTIEDEMKEFVQEGEHDHETISSRRKRRSSVGLSNASWLKQLHTQTDQFYWINSLTFERRYFFIFYILIVIISHHLTISHHFIISHLTISFTISHLPSLSSSRWDNPSISTSLSAIGWSEHESNETGVYWVKDDTGEIVTICPVVDDDVDGNVREGEEDQKNT